MVGYLVVALLMATCQMAEAKKGKKPGEIEPNSRIVVTHVHQSHGVYTIGGDEVYDELQVGGINGVAYSDKTFYAVTSGKGWKAPRCYELDFDFKSDPTIQDTYELDDDVEPLALVVRKDQFYIVDDDSMITNFNWNGEYQGEISPLPNNFNQGSQGLRSLTMDPEERFMWTAPFSGWPEDGSRNVRILQMSGETGDTDGKHEFVYRLTTGYPADPVGDTEAPTSGPTSAPTSLPSSQPSSTPTEASTVGNENIFINMENGNVDRFDPFFTPSPTGQPTRSPTEGPTPSPTSPPTPHPRDNPPDDYIRGTGLVALLALDGHGDFLALERQIVGNNPNHLELFYVETTGALDVTGIPLQTIWNIKDIAVKKTLLLDFDTLNFSGGTPHFDSMTLVDMDDDKLTVVMASNNGYKQNVDTVLTTLKMNYQKRGLAHADVETTEFFGDSAVYDEMSGQAEHAKVWIHPANPAESLIFATHVVGLTVFDLEGQAVGNFLGVPSKESTSPVFTDLDLIYSLPMSDHSLVDLVVVTDSNTNSLNFGLISDLPSVGYLENLTGEIGNLPTAVNMLAVYTSPFTGTTYVFVGGKSGSLIYQLEVSSNDSGLIDATVKRTIQLPNPGTLTAMTVDRDLGHLYVAMGTVEHGGVLKYDAEPGPDSAWYLSVVVDYRFSPLSAPISDLDIYYAEGSTGYLLAALSSDSSYAAFARDESNNYVGSFNVEKGNLDRAMTTEGISVVSVNLGPNFSCGMFLAQDSINARHRVETSTGDAYNVNTNFKLVKMEQVTHHGLPNALKPDTHSSGPRRVALATITDSVAQQVYVAFSNGVIPARYAQVLLGHLGRASSELFRSGSQIRKLMGPYTAAGNVSDESRRRLQEPTETIPSVMASSTTPKIRGLKANNEKAKKKEEKKKEEKPEEPTEEVIELEDGTVVLPRCSSDAKWEEIGSFSAASEALQDFVWKMEDLAGMESGEEKITLGALLTMEKVEEWIQRVQGVIWDLPNEVDYVDYAE